MNTPQNSSRKCITTAKKQKRRIVLAGFRQILFFTGIHIFFVEIIETMHKY